MAEIALFHSVLGVRPGVIDAARRFDQAGHEVRVIDLYQGEVYDDYQEAMQFAFRGVGFPELLARATAATEDLAPGFVSVGFSLGCAPAEYIAIRRGAAGILLLSGALPLVALHEDGWPAGCAVQMHNMLDDPWREQEELDSVASAARASGAPLEIFDYPGDGHLFTDASLNQEYDEKASELLWSRALGFCERF